MQRPMITIELYGKNYIEANNISICTELGQFIVTLQSSGQFIKLKPDEIIAIHYDKQGASWCASCDGALASSSDLFKPN